MILGCTEIELLVKQSDVPEVPLYCSAELHIEAVARVQAGMDTVAQYMPREDVVSGFATKLRGAHGEVSALAEHWAHPTTDNGFQSTDGAGDTDSEYGGEGEGSRYNVGAEMTRLAAGSIIAAVFALVGGIAYRLFRHRRRLPRAIRP